MVPKGWIAILASALLLVAAPAWTQDRPAPDKPVEPGLKDVLTAHVKRMVEPPPSPPATGAPDPSKPHGA